jgi:sirohydrochlorin cobaltochelatase
MQVTKSLIVAATLLAAFSTHLAAADVGIVVVAHGVARGNWNQAVAERLVQIKLPWPVEVAFLASPDGNTIQRSFDKLAETGVKRALVIPMLVSSHSSHVDEIRYYVGLGAKPADEDISTPPVKTKLAVRMVGGIDYHPLVSAEFCARARSLGQAPEKSTVLIVGHGPNEEDNNLKWLDTFGLYARDLRSTCGFAASAGYTLRDDAPDEIRNRATQALRDAVAKASDNGGHAIIMPFLIGSGGVMNHIDERMKGLDYKMFRRGLIDGDVLAQWLTVTASSAVTAWPAGEEVGALRGR